MLGSSPVWAMETTGGLCMVLIAKGDEVETAGLGPHRAVAMHIARKKFPKIKLIELAKGDWIDPACFQQVLPYWEGETERFNQVSRG